MFLRRMNMGSDFQMGYLEIKGPHQGLADLTSSDLSRQVTDQWRAGTTLRLRGQEVSKIWVVLLFRHISRCDCERLSMAR